MESQPPSEAGPLPTRKSAILPPSRVPSSSSPRMSAPVGAPPPVAPKLSSTMAARSPPPVAKKKKAPPPMPARKTSVLRTGSSLSSSSEDFGAAAPPPPPQRPKRPSLAPSFDALGEQPLGEEEASGVNGDGALATETVGGSASDSSASLSRPVAAIPDNHHVDEADIYAMPVFKAKRTSSTRSSTSNTSNAAVPPAAVARVAIPAPNPNTVAPPAPLPKKTAPPPRPDRSQSTVLKSAPPPVVPPPVASPPLKNARHSQTSQNAPRRAPAIPPPSGATSPNPPRSLSSCPTPPRTVAAPDPAPVSTASTPSTPSTPSSSASSNRAPPPPPPSQAAIELVRREREAKERAAREQAQRLQEEEEEQARAAEAERQWELEEQQRLLAFQREQSLLIQREEDARRQSLRASRITAEGDPIPHSKAPIANTAAAIAATKQRAASIPDAISSLPSASTLLDSSSPRDTKKRVARSLVNPDGTMAPPPRQRISLIPTTTTPTTTAASSSSSFSSPAVSSSHSNAPLALPLSMHRSHVIPTPLASRDSSTLVDSQRQSQTPAPVKSSDDMPLPEGWEMRVEKETGRRYFIDHINKATSWVDPRDALTKPKTFEECAGDELPYGWEIVVDGRIGRYFINHNTRHTQLEDPRDPDRHARQRSLLKDYIRVAREGLERERATLQQLEATLSRAEADVAELVSNIVAYQKQQEDEYAHQPSVAMQLQSTIDNLKEQASQQRIVVVNRRAEETRQRAVLEQREKTFQLLVNVERKLDATEGYRLEDARLAVEETDQVQLALLKQRQETEELRLRCEAAVHHVNQADHWHENGDPRTLDTAALNEEERVMYKAEILVWLVENAVSLNVVDTSLAAMLDRQLQDGRVHVAFSEIGDTLLAVLPTIAVLEETLVMHGTRMQLLQEHVAQASDEARASNTYDEAEGDDGDFHGNVTTNQLLVICDMYETESRLVQAIVDVIEDHVGFDALDLTNCDQFIEQHRLDGEQIRSDLTERLDQIMPRSYVEALAHASLEGDRELRRLVALVKLDLIRSAPMNLPPDAPLSDFVPLFDEDAYVRAVHRSFGSLSVSQSVAGAAAASAVAATTETPLRQDGEEALYANLQDLHNADASEAEPLYMNHDAYRTPNAVASDADGAAVDEARGWYGDDEPLYERLAAVGRAHRVHDQHAVADSPDTTATEIVSSEVAKLSQAARLGRILFSLDGIARLNASPSPSPTPETQSSPLSKNDKQSRFGTLRRRPSVAVTSLREVTADNLDSLDVQRKLLAAARLDAVDAAAAVSRAGSFSSTKNPYKTTVASATGTPTTLEATGVGGSQSSLQLDHGVVAPLETEDAAGVAPTRTRLNVEINLAVAKRELLEQQVRLEEARKAAQTAPLREWGTVLDEEIII